MPGHKSRPKEDRRRRAHSHFQKAMAALALVGEERASAQLLRDILRGASLGSDETTEE